MIKSESSVNIRFMDEYDDSPFNSL